MILLYIESKTAEEHEEHLKKALDALKQVPLKLNPKKAQVAVETVKVLGDVVSGGEIKPSEGKKG